MDGASDQARGILASSREFAHYDQVDKPEYHLAEAANDADDFDEAFSCSTCDIDRFLSGNATDRARFAQELGAALHEVGFAILEGHGRDTSLFEAAEDWVTDLFTAHDSSQKLSYRAERHGAVSEGYFPIRETSDIHPDLVEGWVFGRRAFDLDHDPGFDPAALWPAARHEPRFRRLIQAGVPLFTPVMQAILQYLGCDPHLYDRRLAQPDFGQRLNYYPPLDPTDRATGAGRLLGHEDIDLFTLLPAPSVEGLQVLLSDGRWGRVDAPAGSIVVNAGDYLQRISNDVVASTTHRVSPPRELADAQRARTSFPLAAYLPPLDVLTVLPGLGTPKYEPIRVITFHTRTTAKFYGDDYAVEVPV